MERTFRMVYRVDKTVQPWMRDEDVFEEGEIVFEYRGATYGCVSADGVAVTRKRGETPFCEVPWDAVEPVD